MFKRTKGAVCALTIGVSAIGCSSNDGGGQQDPEPPVAMLPAALTPVASSGFTRPADAVSTHDGTTFYFTGIRPGADGEEDEAAIFSVPATGGAAAVVHSGAPLGNPTGLVMSCDGSSLYVADMGISAAQDEEDPPMTERPEVGAEIYRIDTATGALVPLTSTGIGRPTGLALSDDCETLYVTGWTPAGMPSVFTLPAAGGTAQPLLTGEPLLAPTGIHVDKDDVAWVMDYLARGPEGSGVLFAISPDGSANAVVSGLDMGVPGGVSLDSTGTYAVIPTVNSDGQAQLTAVTLASGEVQQVPATAMKDPAGIRTARNAAVFAVVDAESGTIYAAQ